MPPPPAPLPPPRVRFRPLGALRTGRATADALFNRPGPGRVEDPAVRRAQLWRAVTGALSTIALVHAYGTDGGWSDVVDDGVFRLVMAPVLLVLLGPVVVTLFIRQAPPRYRPTLRSRLWLPVKTVGWFFGSYLVCVPTLAGLFWLMERAPSPWNLLVGLAGLAALFWMLPFLLFSLLNTARYAFNAATVHAYLPAVLTVSLVWAFAGVGFLADGMPHNGPPEAQLAALLGGPLTVSLIAVWELHRLRTRFGVRLRT
ncbi:hypothetical protein [Streptomyces albus]|uniref:hypothetical protein n=1 Tax=Streptomyces albus TaxID=1888 RepID=UPI001FC97563|nr:hypothetical protein [Streptomyces albus]